MRLGVREYALSKGAAIMMFPPRMIGAPPGWNTVYPQGTIFPDAGAQKLKIEWMKAVFGKHFWPRNG